MAKERSAAELQKQLDAILATIERQGYKTDQQASAQERIEASLKKQNALQSESLETTKEIDDTLQSIASSYGKQSKIYKKTQAQLGVIQGSVESIESWSSKWVGAAKKGKQEIIGAAKGYRNVNAQVLKNVALITEGKETYENINDLIDDQVTKHKEVLASITSNTAQSKKLKAEIQGEIDAMEALAKGAKKAESNISAISKAGQAFAGTMLGGALDKTMKAFGSKKGVGGIFDKMKQSAGTVQKDGGIGGQLGNVMGGVAKFLGPIGLAVGGIMAAADFFNSGGAAKMAMRLASLTGEDPMKASKNAFKQSKAYRDIVVEQQIGIPTKLRQEAEHDYMEYSISVAEDGAKYKESLISDEINHRMSLESDAISFRQQQESAELDANLARQKTLFTTGMGYMKGAIGVSERALNAIGSSTQSVLETVKAYGYSLGIALKDQIALGAAAAGLGARYMASGEEVFKMADTFRLMNKTSAKTGANLVAGLEAMAKQNDMEPAQLFKQMAEASSDVLKYSNYTTEEFARQEILLGQMNLSMSAMMKASDSMVLNYKDSIKAEMSLSSMMGKNINLSEVRAKLMSGDQAGGAAALKTALGGVDINQMNAFQKQALSQATGMDLQSLMQLQQSKKPDGVKGTLAEKNALKTGRDIAKGALQQDIAGQAAKLALDQKNRAEMMKFEQAKRMAMLFVEQKFKLNAIEREFKYREEREAKGIKVAMENAQLGMLKEAQSEQLSLLTGAFTDSLGPGKFDQAKVAEYQAKVGAQLGELQNAMISGRISDSEVADITMKIFKAAQQGKTIDTSQITGVQQYHKDVEVNTKAQSDVNTRMVAAFEKMSSGSNMSYKDRKKQEDFLEKAYPNTFKQLKMAERMGTRDKFIAGIKKERMGGGVAEGGKPEPAPTVNTPMPVTVIEKTKTKTEPTPTPPLPVNAPKLVDSQAQTKLQVQMVKLLGVSAQFLGQIDANTLNGMKATIDGKPLAKKLLDQANRTYGVAGASF